MNLDRESPNYSNSINTIAQDSVLGEGGIKFPDGGGSFDVSKLCDDAHEICDCEVDDMGETRQAMLVGTEGVDPLRDESSFDVVACRIVIAGIISGDTIKLSGIRGYQYQLER